MPYGSAFNAQCWHVTARLHRGKERAGLVECCNGALSSSKSVVWTSKALKQQQQQQQEEEDDDEEEAEEGMR